MFFGNENMDNLIDFWVLRRVRMYTTKNFVKAATFFYGFTSQEAREQSVYFSCLFLATGATAGVAVFLQITMFTIAGEHLTQRMRRMAFAAMLR